MKYRIITWLFSYFTVLLIAAFLINCFELFIIFSKVIEPTEYNLFINQVLIQGTAVTSFQIVLIIIYSVCFLMVIYPIRLFIKTLKYFKQNDFFNPIVFKYFKIIGYFFLLISIPIAVTETVFYFYNMIENGKPILFFINPFSFMGVNIVIGMFFLFTNNLLSKIQKYQNENINLKQENELTI